MPQIAARIFDTPLLIAPEKMGAILTGLGGRIVDGGVVLDGRAFGVLDDQLGRSLDRQGRRPYEVVNGVAVLPVEGTLVHKGAYIGQSSGETSYQGIQTQALRALRDPNVRAAVFEIDSAGGQVDGAYEAAAALAQLSAAKPTMAILTDKALSGGYLMASTARQIVMPKTGRAGSIGVIAMHTDASAKLEAEGLKVTLITSGAQKADGHPFAPLADGARARIQQSVDATRDLFAESVAGYRGKRLSKAAALATEAGVYEGDAAVKAGLVDAVGSPHEAFAAFVRAMNPAQAA
jgi:signal peptide peptidase SppA